MDPDVLSFMGVMGTIAGFIFVMTLCRGLAHRLGVGSGKRGGCNCLESDHGELAELRERVADMELSARHVEELEERLDFAERMLADVRHGDRLVEPAEHSDTRQ